MAKKKVEKKGNETKIRIWLLVNFAIIMAIGVSIAIGSEVIGIAYVAREAIVDPEAEEVVFNLTKDIIVESNKVMNKSIGLSIGIYALIQFINYAVYLFKKKKILLLLLLAELIAAVVGFSINGDLIVFGIPLISALIYLRVLKLEEV